MGKIKNSTVLVTGGARRLFVERLADTTVQKELLAAIESYDSTSAFRRAIAQYDDICA